MVGASAAKAPAAKWTSAAALPRWGGKGEWPSSAAATDSSTHTRGIADHWRDTPVRIITLSGGSLAKKNFVEAGFKDVVEEVTKTADFRGVTPDDLYRQGLITRLAHLTLEDGQRRSFELPNAGAVGLFVSHLATCSSERATLVLEDDAVPAASLTAQLTASLELARRHKDALDVVIFGPVKTFQDMTPWLTPHMEPAPTPGFEPLGNRGFFGTHGVLYTARGCQLMREALSPPFDMQIDG